MSPNAQNKILQIMALKVLHDIASDIAESRYYSIMADESTDVRNMEQLVICIRWMDNEMTLCEEYVGLMPVTKTNADTIVVCIKDLPDAHGQCYDGCLTMTGTKNGVAAQIKKLNEKCLLVHCHLLNLTVGDTIKIKNSIAERHA